MKMVVESKNDEVSRLSDAVTLLSDRYNILLTEMERLKITKYIDIAFNNYLSATTGKVTYTIVSS
jgi:hypothetical protein